MHHHIFRLSPSMQGFYSKIPKINLTKQEREKTRAVFSVYMIGELRYTQEVFRYPSVIAGGSYS